MSLYQWSHLKRSGKIQLTTILLILVILAIVFILLNLLSKTRKGEEYTPMRPGEVSTPAPLESPKPTPAPYPFPTPILLD